MSQYFHKLTLKNGRDVLVHTGHPTFVAKVTANADGSIDITPVHWLESPPVDASKLAAILRRIGGWYAVEIERTKTDQG